MKRLIQISMRLEMLGRDRVDDSDGLEMVDAMQQAGIEDIPAALQAEGTSEDGIRLLLGRAEVTRERRGRFSAKLWA
jgi:hypothetical protein